LNTFGCFSHWVRIKWLIFDFLHFIVQPFTTYYSDPHQKLKRSSSCHTNQQKMMAGRKFWRKKVKVESSSTHSCDVSKRSLFMSLGVKATLPIQVLWRTDRKRIYRYKYKIIYANFSLWSALLNINNSVCVSTYDYTD